ncbi:hypothetical protein CBR_g41090 [Chara braunii]|uniref:Uncharacterized protein n=1 Tax=Chara braunii TaxID=69332 RepID=A0A388LV31_CHABU|nr:hypothetical protein CBR_g41090 [Chara braunii]|eukprot:GBG86186.1 hypothetical protein CBR_g41090 [Chara braunii]
MTWQTATTRNFTNVHVAEISRGPGRERWEGAGRGQCPPLRTSSSTRCPNTSYHHRGCHVACPGAVVSWRTEQGRFCQGRGEESSVLSNETTTAAVAGTRGKRTKHIVGHAVFRSRGTRGSVLQQPTLVLGKERLRGEAVPPSSLCEMATELGAKAVILVKWDGRGWSGLKATSGSRSRPIGGGGLVMPSAVASSSSLDQGSSVSVLVGKQQSSSSSSLSSPVVKPIRQGASMTSTLSTGGGREWSGGGEGDVTMKKIDSGKESPHARTVSQAERRQIATIHAPAETRARMSLAELSRNDQAFLYLGFIACVTSGALSAMLFAAIPTLLAMKKAAEAMEKLADTAREELPGTMAAIRLSGMEISDLTMELSDLSQEIGDGVRSSARAVQAAEDGLKRVGSYASAQTIALLQERASIPVTAVKPAAARAADNTRQAIMQARKAVQDLATVRRLTGWLANRRGGDEGKGMGGGGGGGAGSGTAVASSAAGKGADFSAEESSETAAGTNNNRSSSHKHQHHQQPQQQMKDGSTDRPPNGKDSVAK